MIKRYLLIVGLFFSFYVFSLSLFGISGPNSVFFEQAASWEQQRDFYKAAIIYEKLHLQDPNNPNYLKKMGELYSYVQDYDKSIKSFKDVLEKNPQDEYARLMLARIYYWKKDYVSAQKEIATLLLQNPKNSDGYLLKGRIFFAQNQVDEAKKNFTEAIDLNPQNQEVLLPLAQVNYIDQKYSKALDLLNKGKQAFPNDQYIKQQIHITQPYVDPSIFVLGGYYYERDVDLITHLKTVSIETIRNQVSFLYPVNNWCRLHADFFYVPEKQKNLIAHLNNYNTQNYLFGLGMENSIRRYWTSNLTLFAKRGWNKGNTNILPFDNETLFEGAFIVRCEHPKHFFLGTVYKDSFIGRNYTIYDSYYVERSQIMAAYEYRFWDDFTAVGANGYLATLHPTNGQETASLWAKWDVHLFDAHFIFKYQYDYRQYDRTVPDYYSYQEEVTNNFNITFLKQWIPSITFVLSYTSSWRYMKNFINIGAPVPIVPEELNKHRFRADTVDATLRFVIHSKLYAELSGNYYHNTDNYLAWFTLGSLRWVF
jgi:tetratricopeptide (TPR) repeat protein